MGGISQAQLVADIISSLDRQGAGRINARKMKAVVDAANAICLHLGIPHAPAVDGSGLTAWLASDDVGIPSWDFTGFLSALGEESPHDGDIKQTCTFEISDGPTPLAL